MSAPRVSSGHGEMVFAAARGDDRALELLVRAYHDRDVMAAPGVLSWLFTVVKNTCLRLLRLKSRLHRARSAVRARLQRREG